MDFIVDKSTKHLPFIANLLSRLIRFPSFIPMNGIPWINILCTRRLSLRDPTHKSYDNWRRRLLCVVIFVASEFRRKCHSFSRYFWFPAKTFKSIHRKSKCPYIISYRHHVYIFASQNRLLHKYSQGMITWKKSDIETAELTQQRVYWLIDIHVSSSTDSAQRDGFVSICVQYHFMMLFINWKIIILFIKNEDTRILRLRKAASVKMSISDKIKWLPSARPMRFLLQTQIRLFECVSRHYSLDRMPWKY